MRKSKKQRGEEIKVGWLARKQEENRKEGEASNVFREEKDETVGGDQMPAVSLCKSKLAYY